jgi:asparagine synthase (glutamine-hydrolysing)
MVEEIRAHLRRAVQKRLSPGETTGVLMSGGLDSTSIAALAHEAAPEKMLAFSLIFPGYPSANESAWLEAMETHLKIPIVRHAAAGPGLLASSIEHLRHWELPPNGWSEAWLQPLLRRAQEHGITAILDGEGGDEMFGSRFYFIADLLRQGRFVTAARFARRLPEFGGQAVSRKMAADHIWQFGIKGLPSAGAITALQRLAPMGNSIPWWASKECATLLATREHAAWRDAAGPRWWAFPALYTLTNNPHAVGLFDIMRRRARQAGLEPRHPLYDLDLLELMLQVPPEACSDGRLSRPLFREAMAGISPDSVRLRRDKVRFDQVLMDALVGHELPALRALFGDAPEIAAYVEPEALTELLERVPPRQRDPLAIWASQVLRFAAMEIWLRSQESRPLPDQFLCELASQSD